MSNNPIAGLAVPPGVDPRMFAFLQAQRQLQQQQQSGVGQHPGGTADPQAHPGQKPGGDADVASFLLQLKTNQNGEPVTEAEALRLQAEHQAALAASRQMPQHAAGHQGYPPAGYHPLPSVYGGYASHHPHHPAMTYQANHASGHSHNFAAAAAAAAMGGMNHPPPHGHAHPPPGYLQAPPGGGGGLPPGGVPGMNHAPPGVPAAGPPDAGPIMTDAYIESLIREKVGGKTDGDDGSQSGNQESEENTSADAVKAKEDSPAAEEDHSDDSSSSSSSGKPPLKSAKDDMDIALVVAKDRDLIPDALFVALGQMKPCRLQQSDRVGCYKTRTLGFLGMCCKHCGGQPGFGRYFPNSVRSLAQTTTSQTILKHVGGKCRFCPPHIRKAVLELQRQQAHKEHLTTGRPRYGSRKIFFQRMWARLHGPSEDGESAVVVQADVTPQKAKEEAERAAAEAAAHAVDAGNELLPVATRGPGGSDVLSIRLPKQVSNNNTDDEDTTTDTQNVLGNKILMINGGGGSHKKRKLKAAKELEEEDEASKKLRISPVAV